LAAGALAAGALAAGALGAADLAGAADFLGAGAFPLEAGALLAGALAAGAFLAGGEAFFTDVAAFALLGTEDARTGAAAFFVVMAWTSSGGTTATVEGRWGRWHRTFPDLR
jgi:hypothetical protein